MIFHLIKELEQANDILDPKLVSQLLKKVRSLLKLQLEKLEEAGLERIPAELEEVVGKVVAEDIFDENTGEVICLANEALSEAKIQELMAAGIKEVKVSLY